MTTVNSPRAEYWRFACRDRHEIVRVPARLVCRETDTHVLFSAPNAIAEVSRHVFVLVPRDRIERADSGTVVIRDGGVYERQEMARRDGKPVVKQLYGFDALPLFFGVAREKSE